MTRVFQEQFLGPLAYNLTCIVDLADISSFGQRTYVCLCPFGRACPDIFTFLAPGAAEKVKMGFHGVVWLSEGDFSLLFTETSNCCWFLKMLLLLVDYKSQMGLFNNFRLPWWWTIIKEVAMLFVILQLSNRGSLLFSTGIQSTKVTSVGTLQMSNNYSGAGTLDEVRTLRQVGLVPPTYWLCGNSFLCLL